MFQTSLHVNVTCMKEGKKFSFWSYVTSCKTKEE